MMGVRPVDRIHSTGGSAPMMERHSFPSGRLYHGKSPAAFGNAGRLIRKEYLIVDGGKLAGVGAHSYTV